MGVPRVEDEFESWSAEGYPLRIQYPAAVLEEICAAAVEGLSRFRHGGVETGGVLYGTHQDGVVRVLAYRPLLCEYAFGPRFVLSERDRARLRELVRAPAHDPTLRGMEAVGWYHSHTRSGVTLSPRDLEVYERYFPAPWQIALVLHPDQFGPSTAGFFLRAEMLFAVEVKPRRRRAEPAPEPVREPEPQAEAPALPVEAAEPEPPAPVQTATRPDSRGPEETELPSWAAQAPEPSPWRKGWWAALALVLVGAAGFGVLRYWQTTAPSPPLALWVADVGGQLLIEWDRTARPVRNATRGVIEIRDGNQPVRIEMDASRLREGSVDYVRQSEVVDVRLRVEHPGGAAQELIRFVGPPVSRQDEAAKERDALKAEVERLQAENARLRGRIAANAARKTP